jgi:hypothetical protein
MFEPSLAGGKQSLDRAAPFCRLGVFVSCAAHCFRPIGTAAAAHRPHHGHAQPPERKQYCQILLHQEERGDIWLQ